MSEFFLKIVNMSISASWLVLAVLLLRLVLKKAPKWVSVVLWGLVAVRLICPFFFESMLSLIPSAETISPEIMMDWTPEVSTGIGSLDTVVNPIITESFAPKPYASANPLQILIPVCGNLWILGILVMLVYTAVSYILLRRKVATAVLLRNNIYQSENVDSPFVLGIMKPKIYLPFQIDGQNLEYVIAHEASHIRRKDHWWKPFGFLLLTIHWFNPLMWLGYIFLCRDIELACDERVIKEMDNESKADYTQALVACSVNRRSIAACPLAFGEIGVKERVKSVMHYKKPAFWVIVSAIVICIVVAVCFLTNPSTGVNERLSVFIDCQIAGHFQTEKSEGNACCVNWEVLGTKKRGSVTTVYMWVLYEEYSMRNGELYEETGAHIPTLITVKREDGEYKLIEYWEPRDGSFLEPGIREKFPWYLQHKALDSQRYIKTQHSENEKMALDYFLNDVTTGSLNAYYPAYFGLDTTNGLDVYVWQMSKNSYSFGLLPHSETARDRASSELMELKGASADEMRTILASYDIAQDEIYVIPWQNPISSYIAECWIANEGDDLEAKTKAYIQNIREMLFSVTATAHDEIIAKSGENTVPMIAIPKGTAAADYVDSLYWLTINPGEDDFVPFSVWRDGEEVRGHYTAVDAETFEPLKYFLPSGLDPQTYLFRNADPTRAYIVSVTFSMDSHAEVYAFGAIFDSSISHMGGVDNSNATEKWAKLPMIRVNGVLYLDTGHNSNTTERTDHFDGVITSQVEISETPNEDDQSNFGTGYGYQYGAIAGTVELYLNGKWRIYATEEVRQQLQFP